MWRGNLSVFQKVVASWVWWLVPVILAVWRWRPEDLESQPMPLERNPKSKQKRGAAAVVT